MPRCLWKEFGGAKFKIRSLNKNKELRNLVESDAVEIGIQDNGTGIPQNILDRIFAPFFTTKPQGKGTGVGLYFAHNLIVTRNECQISVDSKLGVCTTFTIILPKNIA